MAKTKKKHNAHVEHLVEEILKVCGDAKSARFYNKVSGRLPDQVIFRFLSEIRQDDTIRNRGAVFTVKVKAYLARQAASGER